MTKRNGGAEGDVLTRPLYIVALGETPTTMRLVRWFSYGAFKRGTDLIISAVMLVLLSPLFLVVAIAIKIDSPGPVFFCQVRTGKRGKEFRMYKFRSMVAENDMRDTSCEDKFTRVGEVIRRLSIDELPQFINVLLGQMSLIGPRPWVPEYWENMNDRERGRYAVRPGITGLAAAKGRNGLTIFEKIEYDLEYVRNFSFKQDVKVVFLTLKQLLVREEVNAGKSGVHNDLRDLKKENRK